MPDALIRLFNYIVEHKVLQNERREAQLDATAVQDINREIAKVTRDEKADAVRLAPFFAQGLRMALKGPVTVDDSTPEGNAIAEAFARYLVAPGLGTAQSAPLDGSHFSYTFEVNWPQLRDLARVAGVDFDALAVKG